MTDRETENKEKRGVEDTKINNKLHGRGVRFLMSASVTLTVSMTLRTLRHVRSGVGVDDPRARVVGGLTAGVGSVPVSSVREEG